MRIVVLCANPRLSASEENSAASVLTDLGCDVTIGRFDLDDLTVSSSDRPSIIVLDAGDEINLATRSLKLLNTVTVFKEIPILLVTSVRGLSVVSFSIGFDDFLLSPIVPAEFYARIRQLDWRTADFGSDEIVKIGDLVIDVAGYEVRLGGRLLPFPHQEFELLRFLAQNRGRVFSREQLLRDVWGDDYSVGIRTVDIHIRRVRAKLGTVLGGLIVTVRNVGYKMIDGH